MYTGTMIEDLIETVARAEAHTQPEPAVQAAPAPAPPQYGRDYEYAHSEQLLGVA